ncbi:hypothetical protein PFTANZ_03621 [Plasmodium falciparum Tanzania (2000708)]|uniref:J domain-containing protein n=1 Tax=Plasmodium falciparum Tanzania (2000708) TaxID=1036725 RepID=A0A024W530_PLAFA|nr:hypothetical protein PFTANZ_03621 [Plasmodium falciparum Tanzania (2000708)]
MKPYSSAFSKQYMGTKSVKAKNPTIYSFEEEKQNENMSLLKSLCSKRLVLPILGILYIILNGNFGYNGSSNSGAQFTDRCSRNLYGETLPINPYADSENPIVVSQVFGLPSEKPTFTLEGTPDIDHTNILGFNEKLMTDVNRYRYSNNYEAIPHTREFNPLIVDKVLFDYNEKVDNLGRSGGDIIKKMQTLWDEIMDINKRKYDFLKTKLQKTYSQYNVQYDMPKEVYESKWGQCLKLINQGGDNLEERLNTQFKNWYRQKYLNLEEYRRLTVLNQIAWKALSNQIQYTCRKIMNSNISSFKHISELKSLEQRAAKAAQEEMRKRAEKQKKKKSKRRGWLCCGGGDNETVEPQQEEPVQDVGEHQINEYGDILPSLKVSINNSAINYYDAVKDDKYLDDDSSDALYTDEDLLFDLEKQKYMDMLDGSEDESVEDNEEEHSGEANEEELSVEENEEELSVDENVEEQNVDESGEQQSDDESGEHQSVNEIVEEQSVNEIVEEQTVDEIVEQETVDENVEEQAVDENEEQQTVDENVEQQTIDESQVQEEISTIQENIEEVVSEVQQDSEVDRTLHVPDTRFYDILGVGVNADMKEISESYFKLAKQYYPPKYSVNEGMLKFKQISEAYQILGDIDKRKMYNKFGYDGIKGVNFIHPTIYYMLASLEKFAFYTGSPQIVTLMKFLFEKKLTVNDLDTKSEHLSKIMGVYQKERETYISENLISRLHPYIDSIRNWDVRIKDQIYELMGSPFDIAIIDSIGWTLQYVSMSHMKNPKKAIKKLETRSKKNKETVAYENNKLMNILREYFGNNEQINSITYNMEYNTLNENNENGYRNILNLNHKKQKKLFEEIISYIVNISLSDIENTVKNSAESILTVEGLDEKKLSKRIESLRMLANVIRKYILRGKKGKKYKNKDAKSLSGNIANEINLINKELQNLKEHTQANIPEHIEENVQENMEENVEENVEENFFLFV